jgi:hypothetical protein
MIKRRNKMRNKTIVAIIILLAAGAFLYFAPSLAAETCYYEPYYLSSNLRSVDQYFASRICTQPIVDKYWNTFGFKKKYWDDGFGYEDVCNWQKPLGRIMAALYLLENSYSPKATSLSDWSGPGVRWAYPYSGTVYKMLDDLRGKCYNNDWWAYTSWGPFTDDRIEYYWPLIYHVNTFQRAAIVLHEGHHYGIKENHSCNDYKDTNWEDWRPYASETYYLISYYWSANRHTSSVWKSYAADRADARIASKFCNPPPAWVQNFR